MQELVFGGGHKISKILVLVYLTEEKNHKYTLWEMIVEK